MSEKEAIEVLIKFNEWRRFDGDIKNSPEMPDPKTIGKAIDTVVSEYQKHLKTELLKALQIYLNAGCKDTRREASVIAKKAISKALD